MATEEYVHIQRTIFSRKIFLSKVKVFMATMQEITDIFIVIYATPLIPTCQKFSLLELSRN